MNKFLGFMFACHRLPERSFFFRGRQFPICARCTGILFGYFVGLIYAFIFGSIPLYIAFLLMLPLVVDGGIQYLGYLQSTNIRRFTTGILAGVSVDFIIYGIASLGYNHGKILAKYLMDAY